MNFEDKDHNSNKKNTIKYYFHPNFVYHVSFMTVKMKGRGEAKPQSSDCCKQRSKEVLSVSPNHFQSLACWKRIVS